MDLKQENMIIQENGRLMLVDFDPSTKLPPKSPESRSISFDSGSTLPQFASLEKERFGFLGNRRREKSGISSESSEAESVEKSNSFVGTEEYVAPEVILGDGKDFSLDWWCLGIVLYEMLYEMTPLRGSNQKETFYRIVSRRRTKLESAVTSGIKLLLLTKNLGL